jgi:hypothetical protein
VISGFAAPCSAVGNRPAHCHTSPLHPQKFAASELRELARMAAIGTGRDAKQTVAHLELGRFERRGAEGAAARRDRYIAEAFRASFCSRVRGHLSAAHPQENLVHRQHDEEIYGRADEDERDNRIDEVADCESARMNGELYRREIRFPNNGRDQRGDQIFDQCGDDSAKCRAHHHCDGEIENVAA